ncbi:hypothetical protein KQX54_000161, partial [Cotesia glomerata]
SHEELSNPSFRIREPIINNPSSIDSSSTEDDDEEQAAINKIKAARKVTNEINPENKISITADKIEKKNEINDNDEDLSDVFHEEKDDETNNEIKKKRSRIISSDSSDENEYVNETDPGHINANVIIINLGNNEDYNSEDESILGPPNNQVDTFLLTCRQ